MSIDKYRMQSDFCQIFTHPLRVRILHLLGEHERCVNDLVAETKLAQPTLSQHLAVLRRHGVVKTRREGTTIHYSLTDLRLLEACRLLQSVIGELPKESTLVEDEQ